MTKENAPVNDADVLFPDAEIVIKGEPITVREFSFLQGIKLASQVAPLLRDMAKTLMENTQANLTELSDLFANHEAELVLLLQTSTGKNAQWIEALSDIEGQKLLMVFWGVNKDFFINRLLVMKLVAARQTQEPASPSASSLTA